MLSPANTRSISGSTSKACHQQGGLLSTDVAPALKGLAAEFSEKWTYVSENPVRKGLVMHPNEWLFQGQVHELRWTGN